MLASSEKIGLGFYDLPSKFTNSMKILFDILDDDGTGYILLSDLENWWDADAAGNHVHGEGNVLDALRKIALPNGRLSFDRFVAGLKVALLRNKEPSEQGNSKSVSQNGALGVIEIKPRGYSEQYLRQLTMMSVNASNSVSMPNGPPRTFSMPVLGETVGHRSEIDLRKRIVENGYLNSEKENLNGNVIPWHTERSSKENGHNTQLKKDRNKEIQNNDRHFVTRRHTVANGVDYNFIQRMKLIQQEREVLEDGLAAVEIARQWYMYQLKELHKQQKHFEKNSSPDYSMEANNERIQLEKLRISSVNNALKALVDSSKKGFPHHMNLAINQLTQDQTSADRDLQLLKMRNWTLTQEVSQKAELITKLEREKILLVREMFRAKTCVDQSFASDDTTTLI